MTDRYNALIVVLEGNVRDDDAEPLLAAIRQLCGVLSVSGLIGARSVKAPGVVGLTDGASAKLEAKK